MTGARHLAARLVPAPVRRWWRARHGKRSVGVPQPGQVRLGDLERLTPLDGRWGFGRGRPVDRHYIEDFLGRHRSDVHGRVLEIADDGYARQFGRDLLSIDVLHRVEGNPKATIVGDLQAAPHIPDGAFDCAIVTQTLQMIWDVPAAITTLHRILAPGGVLLATVPGISKISGYDSANWGDFWRFTESSARRLASSGFGAEAVQVEAFGNVLTATAFLYGMADSELTEQQLDHHDGNYQVLLAIRAVKW
jgi:SAM-dependent methyltransferase